MKFHPTIMRMTRGFSAIELMTTLAVAAILLTIGVPSFRTLLENQRMTTTVNNLFAAINLTRAEAVQRGTRIDLAPLDGADWTKGWAVFVDKNNNQKPDTGTDEIIFSTVSIADGITISTSLTDSSTQYIAYSSTGRTRTSGPQTPQLGTITFTQNGEAKRRIILNFLGRARVCDPVKEAATCTATVSNSG